MGSLQTEIQKTLNSWGTTQAPVADSIARRVFDFVKDNPSCTSTEAVDQLKIDLGRTSAALLTLYQKGKLDRKSYPNVNPNSKRETIYRYWTAVDNFNDKGTKRVEKKPKKVKASTEKPVLFKEPEQYEMPRMKQFAEPKENPYESAYVILNNMSIQVASDVYKALKEMFK